MQTAHAQTDKARAGLTRLKFALERGAELAVRAAVQEATASARGTDRFTDRTGDTRRSIRGEAVGQRGFVSAGGVAILLESGTRAHQIIARGHALRFVVNGQTLYRKMVQHPGTSPRPFMSDARERGALAGQIAAQEAVIYAIQH